MKWSATRSVMSDSLQPHGLYSPWNSPGQNTGVGSCSFLQGIFSTLGIKPRSPTLQADSLPAEPQAKPKNTGIDSLALLQQIFLTQELNQGLLHCRRIFYQLSYQESPKENELWRTEAFELWCWRRLLRVPWTAKSSYQSILKEISPEYSLEELLLTLKLQHFGHLMRRTDSLEKTLMLGKTEGRRRRGQQRTRWLDGITDSMDMNLSDSRSWCWTGKRGVLQSMGSQRVVHD